ncbi:MAG: sensor histidine kinase, partial [Rhodoferax sp.]
MAFIDPTSRENSLPKQPNALPCEAQFGSYFKLNDPVGSRVTSERPIFNGDVQLRVVFASQVVLLVFAFVVAAMSFYWYTDARHVATERLSRVIANQVQKHIDPLHPDLNDPKLLEVMREALKLDESIYMIAVLDGQGSVVNAVGESAPYAKGIEILQHVMDPSTDMPTSTVQVRASSNPFEMALAQPFTVIVIILILWWIFSAYVLYRLLRAALNPTLAASQEFVHQCSPLLKVQGLQDADTKNLPQLFISARQSLLHAEQQFQSEVAARTSALRSAYDLSLEAARTDAKHLRNLDAAIERERERIALEIHDTLNAQTVALRLYASAIRTRANSFGDPEIIELADKFNKEMSTLFDVARGIVRGLRPELIESVGLVGALTQLATTIHIGPTTCKLNVDPNVCEALNTEQAFAIYRVAQEATTNAQKHSDATEIS